MRIELEDWAAGLAEARMPGAEAVKLRDEATAVRAALPDGTGSAAAWRMVRARLERCLEIIDPDRLRDRITPWAMAGPKGDEPEEVRRWRAIVDDVQECLRLVLLTVIGELAGGPGEPWSRWESEILAAYRALCDQPALAERMVRDIRDTALVTAA